jgi:flagellar protein FliS
MNLAYARNAYTSVKVKTSITPLDLVILLYDGAIESLQRAVFYLNQNNIEKKIYFISKCMAIIEELLSSLNMEAGGEVANNLQSLYVYMLKELVTANAYNDKEKIRHIEYLLTELRSAWKQIREQNL